MATITSINPATGDTLARFETLDQAGIDAALAKLTALGGAVHRGKTEIPGIGWFAVVADPQGAGFHLFQTHPDRPLQADPPQVAKATADAEKKKAREQAKADKKAAADQKKAEKATADAKADKNKKESALAQYTVDLNEKAKDGRVDPLIGRGAEVDRTIQILCRRSKNNPLYVGEPGVGKTAIAEGLARRIVEKQVPEIGRAHV